MRHKELAWTGVSVPVVGQGTYRMEYDRADECVDALKAGLEVGMTHVDTAELYGSGKVEELVGRALEGIELRCDEHGELLARGPNVMLGYWNNPEATAAMIDKDGWLHTGDLVTMCGGSVTITGRIKDILVLSNGEKLPPTDAEQAILRDAAFEQAMVVGEGRHKLGLLAVSKIEDATQLCARANAQLHDFPGYARICHVARLAEPWTVENGLLTPTLKIKRREIEKRFAREIEAMYAASNVRCPSGERNGVA